MKQSNGGVQLASTAPLDRFTWETTKGLDPSPRNANQSPDPIDPPTSAATRTDPDIGLPELTTGAGVGLALTSEQELAASDSATGIVVGAGVTDVGVSSDDEDAALGATVSATIVGPAGDCCVIGTPHPANTHTASDTTKSDTTRSRPARHEHTEGPSRVSRPIAAAKMSYRVDPRPIPQPFESIAPVRQLSHAVFASNTSEPPTCTALITKQT